MQVDVNFNDLLSPQFEPLVIRRFEHVVEDAIRKTLKENFVTKLEHKESTNEVVLAMREMENRISKSIYELQTEFNEKLSKQTITIVSLTVGILGGLIGLVTFLVKVIH